MFDRSLRLIRALCAAAIAGAWLLVLCVAVPVAAQEDVFEFHGLRAGMDLDAIRAAGYGLVKGTDTTLSGEGWKVSSGLPPALQRMTLFLFNHRLFQIDVTYPSVSGEEARVFIRELHKRYGGGEGGERDPLRDAKWTWQGMTFHYSPGISAEGFLTPNLLITHEEMYRRAREIKERPPEGRGL